MEFVPQYYSPETEHHFHPYAYPTPFYMMEGGNMPPQDLDSSSGNQQSSSSSQQCAQGEDVGSTSQKEQEETDTSSRPRLTSEQTSVLESHFQQESKPVTEVKKRLALQVGLPLDKVNNWYQNRRAKAKHLKKLRYLEFHPDGVLNNLYHGFPSDLMSPLCGPVTYFGPELVAMQQATVPADYPTMYTNMLHPHPALEHPQPRDPGQIWAGLPDLDHQLQVHLEPGSHDHVVNEQFMESQNSNVFATEDIDESLDATAFPHWENEQHEQNLWTTSHTADGQLANAHAMLLQQQAPPLYIPEQNGQHLDDNTTSPHSMAPHHVYGHDSNESSQTVLAPQAQETQAQQPEAVVYATTHHHSPSAEEMPRAGSHHSSVDLTESFNNIDFQKVRTSSKTEETELQTNMHAINLAMRRNRQRPPTLGLRSHSAASPQRSSPSSKPHVLAPQNSLRRIKSMGNSLNVMSGRVQKSVPAQKSPLNYTTFQEAGVFDHADEPTPQNIKVENCPPADLTPQTSHDPTMGMGPAHWPQPDAFENHSLELSEHSSQANHSIGHAGSRSVSIPQQHQVMSPPHTPFGQETHQVNYVPSGQCVQYTAPPQSAPPYLTSFPHHSPPHPQQTTPVTPAGCYAPRFNVPEAYQQFYPGAAFHLQQQQAPIMAYPPNPQGGMHFPPPLIIGSSPPMAGHSMFYPQPPAPPAKELEFIQTTFPEPPKVDQGVKEPYQHRVYTFHHMSASDLTNTNK